MQALCSLVPEIDDLSGPIADLEPDGKGIPILVKQYVRLGGRLLAFSVDPQFGNTLDGFVMVDLRQTAPEILARYMGKERARQFFAVQQSVQLHIGNIFLKPPALMPVADNRDPEPGDAGAF